MTQEKLSRAELRKLRDKAYSMLHKGPGLGPSELARQLNVSKSTARNWLDRFKADKQRPDGIAVCSECGAQIPTNYPDEVGFARGFAQLLIETQAEVQTLKAEVNLLEQENVYLKSSMSEAQRQKTEDFRAKLAKAIAQSGD